MSREKNEAPLLEEIASLRTRIEELERAHVAWQAVLDAVRDAILVFDRTWKVIAANQTASSLLSIPYAEIIGKSCCELYRRSKILPQEELLVKIKQTKTHAEAEVYLAEQKRWILVSADPIFDERYELSGVVHIARDITLFKETEVALRRSEEKFMKAFKISPIGIAITTLEDGRIMDCNESFLKIWGLPRENIVGRRTTELGIWHGDEREEFVRRVLAGEWQNVERRADLTNGQRRYILSSSTVAEISGEQRIISFAVDITALKQLEERVRHTHKLEAIATLAGGVAHEFNNLLMGVLGYSHLLLKDAEEGSEMHRKLTEICRLAEHGARLTSQLLAFSRQQMLAPIEISVRAYLNEMAEMLRKIAGEGIAVEMKLSPDVGHVRVDPKLFEDVIVNLTLNARDAMPHGGTLTIEAANATFDHIRQHGANLPPGEYVLITVSDTGVGISPEIRQRIFEPFFTTKDVGKGTGLGLAAVYGIVQQHGGDIWVESEPGKGSTFRICLPRVIPEERPPACAKSPLAAKTILLVDDAPVVREVIREILTEDGYRVLVAASADEAEAIFAQHGGDISLLLADIVMPGRNGVALYRSLKEKSPGLKVIFMSGYSDEIPAREEAALSEAPFIAKPVNPDELLQKICEVLCGVKRAHLPLVSWRARS